MSKLSEIVKKCSQCLKSHKSPGLSKLSEIVKSFQKLSKLSEIDNKLSEIVKIVKVGHKSVGLLIEVVLLER